MPKLAESHRVIAVDIRGMGASDKPEGGYDKKNMAQDIYELIQSRGLEKVHIVGHDIGGHIAYPFSVLYPEATLSTTYLDVGGLPASTSQMTLLPPQVLSGEFRKDFFIWWFAFHQVHGMPEQLIEGRAHIYLDWFWDSLLYDQDAITEFDRAVYADAYNTPAAIRAGDGWYQAYPQDLIDNASFPEKIDVPSLGIGGLGYGLLADFMENRIANPKIVQLDVGHYVAEEAPEAVTDLILDFIGDSEGQ
nr:MULTISPECIES: alpha/beta hydrolase [unclassified Devosia]